jgi:hypothetical protein
MKKFTQIIMLMLVILSLSVPVFAADAVEKTVQFADVKDTYWANESIQKLVKAGYIVGYPDGTFKPDGAITRAEVVRIVNKVYGYTQKQANTKLTDIKDKDWFYQDVLIAQNMGYIKGYPDNTFKPDNNITREELCTILDSINKFVVLPYDKTIKDEVSDWATGYVNKIVSNRIMSLDKNNNFRAKENATRAEVCEAVAKFVIVEDKPVVVPVPTVPSGGGSSTPVVPDTDTKKQKINEAMASVIQSLTNGVMPQLTTDAQKQVVNDIIANMNAYKADSTYDYKAAANAAREQYKLMSNEERESLKTLVLSKCYTTDITLLADFLFPGVSY